MGLDLASGKVVNYSNSPDGYEEPEGIFPDGMATLMECDAHDPHGSQHIDIYRLVLDGSGRSERLTYFADFGWKASNPVVSDDGRYIAFQSAHRGDVAGVGHGIFVLDLEALQSAKRQPETAPQ